MRLILLFGLFFCSSAFAASTNYDAIYSNDDGSVTIVRPRFSSANGGNLRLSSKSNSAGVCKLFGFKSAVARSEMASGDSQLATVIINELGRFGGYYQYNSRFYNSPLDSLICRNSIAKAPPSVRAESIRLNDDGSTTIVSPKFSAADGYIRDLSSQSDFAGVCKLYGFNSYVNKSALVSSDQQNNTVIIDSAGTFGGFYWYNSRYNNPKINSLICQ